MKCKWRNRAILLGVLSALFFAGGVCAGSPGAIPLGSADTFGVIAAATITSTGNSVINGNVSLEPGTSITGFPPGIVNGTVHINDAVSAQARIDLVAAYSYGKDLPAGTIVPGGSDLGALYPSGIPPGTYTSDSTMYVSTPLVLDAMGDEDAVWVFQIGSSLTTTASVSLANGAQSGNVFWVPTTSATIGTYTNFEGTIIAGVSITAATGTTINGRLLAGAVSDTGAVSLDTTTVNVPAPVTTAPQMALLKTSDKASAAPGEEITYLIHYRNTGDGTANFVIITDSIPVNTTYVPGSLRIGDVSSDYATATVLTDAEDADRGYVSGNAVIFNIGTVAQNDGVPDSGLDEGKVYFKVKAN